MRALVIEDDRATAKLVGLLLAEQGFSVDVVHTAAEGRSAAMIEEYDLLVLDLTLPDASGGAVLLALRRAGRLAPVLVLTARDSSSDIVALLDAGADDYLVKPVENDVFRARVRALMRRGGTTRRDVFTVGSLVLNTETREALVGGSPLPLRAQEYRLLHHFVLNAGAVVTRTDLLEKVWDMHFDPGSNVVDVAVARLRRKLEQHAGAPEIRTLRGLGYSLRVRASAGVERHRETSTDASGVTGSTA
ncbi:MAG TPA: response regulator transcription factor [Gemmatimonadaceae bacterium]|nr:response regulator transcription factor [Gemmatimonadaceae bacterium]